MRIRCILAVLALQMMGSVCAEELRTIQIQVMRTPKFDVIYHRALSNATGAAFGGLIGAGIQSGIEADRDAKKRAELSPHVTERVWSDVFVSTLSETLRAKGFAPLWTSDAEPAAQAKTDAYLILFPESYGFRMVDTTAKSVSAYIEFDAIYAQGKINARKKPPKESFYVTDKKQAAYESLLQEAALLNGEVEAVLAQAARRLANKIVYNIK